MPTIKIGRRTVAAIQKPERPTLYWDEELPGFGVLAQPSGGKTWIAQYRAGARGRGASTRRVTLGPVDDAMPAEKARAAAKDLLARVRLGADPAAERAEERAAETFGEIAERWMREHVTPKRKPGTATFYRTVLDSHVLPALGSKRAIAINRQDITRLHGEIAGKRRAATKAGAKRSAETKTKGGRTIANRALATVAAAFAWAIDLGLLPEGSVNPAKGVEPFKEQGRERFLIGEEMQRLGEVLRLAETEGLPWELDETKPADKQKHAPKAENRRVKVAPAVAAAVRLLLLTGCRLREVLNLEWQRVDFERGMLHLADSKTGRKTVVLGSAALAILEELHRGRIGRYVIASESAGAADEAPRRDLNRPWRAIRKAAGLEGTRLHDLRHTAAATGAAAGLSLHQIGNMLGHSQARTTQRYAHLAADPQRRAADMIGNEVAAALGLGGAVKPESDPPVAPSPSVAPAAEPAQGGGNVVSLASRRKRA